MRNKKQSVRHAGAGKITAHFIRFRNIAGRRQQAEAVTKTMDDEVATKGDIAKLKSEIANIRKQLEQRIAETRAEMARFRAEVHGRLEELNHRVNVLQAKMAVMKVMLIGAFASVAVLLVKAFLFS